MSLTLDQQGKLIALHQAAKAAGHIFPEAAACEGVVETTWGTSKLYTEDLNVFGMKQHEHPIYGTVVVPTKEFLHGEWMTINAPFVKYPDLASCFADRMDTLRRLAPAYPHYAAALKATTPEQYLTEVSASWSTGPKRGQDCITVLHLHADLLK